MKSVLLRPLQNLSMSAASGLLFLNDTFYVVADDELCLHVYYKNSPLPQSAEGDLWDPC
jgi:hypothetical protein